MFDFLRNNTLSRAELSESEGHTLNIHYGDILVKFGEVIDANRDALPRIADDGLTERLSCHSLADGDVIIADTAEDEAVGKCSELRGCGSERIVSGLHTMACRPMDEFAQGYLGYYLNSPAFHNQLLPLMQGIKVVSVSKGAISDTDVRFPSFLEQHAIGQSLSSLDSLITLHQRKCQYRGLYGYLSWEQRKLGELCELNPTAVLPGSFEYVDLESVVGTDMISHRREEKLTAPSRAQRLASFGDIFYQTVRPYQKNNYFYELPDKDYVFSTGYAQLRPLCDGRFLFSSLQRDQFVSCVLEHCTGTSYPAINSNDLAALSLAVPIDAKEQRLVGLILKPIDSLITLHQ